MHVFIGLGNALCLLRKHPAGMSVLRQRDHLRVHLAVHRERARRRRRTSHMCGHTDFNTTHTFAIIEQSMYI